MTDDRSSTPRPHHIVLIPGFLGIENLGELVYFAHVGDLLGRKLRELGHEVEVHAVRSYATSSVRKRTRRLLETIAERVPADAHLHLVGHSTGGLDARLLCTPEVRLGSEHDAEAVASRVRSIVTIACPHHGTPLASFFTTRLGAQLLGVLSLGTIYLFRYGRLPISVIVKLAALLVRLHSRIGKLENTIAEQMLSQLLGDFSAERRDELSSLFQDMAQDQALMPQLMPESMDMFNAAAGTRDGIRCGSVVIGANSAPLRGAWRLGFDPYAQATHALFEVLHGMTEEMPKAYLPQPSAAEMLQLTQGLGRAPTFEDNDGIVPVLSQLWGELIHVTRADHFDVIGHFSDPQREPAHFDWLASGCQFDHARFEALWGSVAGFVARAAARSA